MEAEFTYNQAVFGLMLLGAKADGKLQEEEKKLLVELTSEEHHLSAEEYKFVINEAKEKNDADFSAIVYKTLNAQSHEDKVKAAYWLLQLIKSDTSSNDSVDQSHNKSEYEIFNQALQVLNVKNEDVDEYEKTRQL
jgi:uncharacterized tellurite resistance protein B-like protein